MKMNKRMKKGLSILLCVLMLVQYVPTHAFGAAEEGLCEHHTAHTADCGYAAAAAGQDCTHAHSEDCYAILECLHTCGDECANGCAHECTVESGCITRSLDCSHVHGDCSYSEGTAEVPCGYACAECAANAFPSGEGGTAPTVTEEATSPVPSTEAAEEPTEPSTEATEPSTEATEPSTVAT